MVEVGRDESLEGRLGDAGRDERPRMRYVRFHCRWVRLEPLYLHVGDRYSTSG